MRGIRDQVIERIHIYCKKMKCEHIAFDIDSYALRLVMLEIN